MLWLGLILYRPPLLVKNSTLVHFNYFVEGLIQVSLKKEEECLLCVIDHLKFSKV